MTEALIGLTLGVVLGFAFPITVTAAHTKLFAVVLLAALDAFFGGLRSAANEQFSNRILLTGFLLNALLAAFLVFLGESLNLDLYYIALIIFGVRIFKNLASLRRHWLKLPRD